MSKPLKIVYLGSGEFGLPPLEAMRSSPHSLDFVVTQPSKGAGRGRKVRATPVAAWAQDNGLPFMETDNVNAPECVERIAACRPDILVVIAFGQFIGENLINLPPYSAINVHASLLPKYRGAAPINWAILNGEDQTGITIFRLVKKMDAGPIVAQTAAQIRQNETAEQLHDKLAELAAPLLLDTLDQMATGRAVYQPQDESKATFAPKLKKEDGLLDFSQTADLIQRKIRAFWPWPGAACQYIKKSTAKSEPVTIAAAEVIERQSTNTTPGTLDENLNIICGKGALKITKLKPAGKALMDFKDFTNGRNTRPGDSFR